MKFLSPHGRLRPSCHGRRLRDRPRTMHRLPIAVALGLTSTSAASRPAINAINVLALRGGEDVEATSAAALETTSEIIEEPEEVPAEKLESGVPDEAVTEEVEQIKATTLDEKGIVALVGVVSTASAALGFMAGRIMKPSVLSFLGTLHGLTLIVLYLCLPK